MYKVIKNNNTYEIESEGVIYSEGSEINSFIKYTDEVGRTYKKDIKGIIHQITKNLIALKINGFVETFQIPELFHVENNLKVNNNQLDLESYSEDTIKDCIEDLKKKNKGFVFTKAQLEKVYEKVGIHNIQCKYEDGIYMLKIV